MAESSQAREVVLEIGENLGTQVITTQVQTGTVEKYVLGDCVSRLNQAETLL